MKLEERATLEVVGARKNARGRRSQERIEGEGACA